MSYKCLADCREEMTRTLQLRAVERNKAEEAEARTLATAHLRSSSHGIAVPYLALGPKSAHATRSPSCVTARTAATCRPRTTVASQHQEVTRRVVVHRGRSSRRAVATRACSGGPDANPTRLVMPPVAANCGSILILDSCLSIHLLAMVTRLKRILNSRIYATSVFNVALDT